MAVKLGKKMIMLSCLARLVACFQQVTLVQSFCLKFSQYIFCCETSIIKIHLRNQKLFAVIKIA